MEFIDRTIRIAIIALSLFFLYIVVIISVPLALLVLAVDFSIRWLTTRYKKEADATVPILWIIAIGLSAWIINVLCIPFGMLWYWIRGKPMPHPVD